MRRITQGTEKILEYRCPVPSSIFVALLFFLPISLGGANLWAGAREAESVGLGRSLFLVKMCGCSGLGAVTLRMIRDEVSRVYKRAGIEIAWLQCGPECYSTVDPPFAARVYIRERVAEQSRKAERNLGYDLSVISDYPGAVIYISRSAVEKFIGRRTSLRPCVLARALGRVVAHELAHRFLKQKDHTRDGILRAGFSRKELTDPLPKRSFFTKEQMRLMQSYALSSEELKRVSTPVATSPDIEEYGAKRQEK